ELTHTLSFQRRPDDPGLPASCSPDEPDRRANGVGNRRRARPALLVSAGLPARDLLGGTGDPGRGGRALLPGDDGAAGPRDRVRLAGAGASGAGVRLSLLAGAVRAL